MQIEFANIKEDEVDEVKHFIEQNLQSTVGYWTEEDVEKKALQWKSSMQLPDPVPEPHSFPDPDKDGVHQPNDDSSENQNNVAEKRKQAKSHIASISTLDDALALLNKLCDEGGEWLLDKINS